MSKRCSAAFIVWCLMMLQAAKSERVPHSPCPDIFRYENGGHELYGIITRPSSPYGTTMKLTVKMTVGERLPTGSPGKISLATSNDKALSNVLKGLPILYRVEFPPSNKVPKITDIIFDDTTVCKGPPDKPGSGVWYISMITLLHDFTTGDGNLPIHPGFQYTKPQSTYHPDPPFHDYDSTSPPSLSQDTFNSFQTSPDKWYHKPTHNTRPTQSQSKPNKDVYYNPTHNNRPSYSQSVPDDDIYYNNHPTQSQSVPNNDALYNNRPTQSQPVANDDSYYNNRPTQSQLVPNYDVNYKPTEQKHTTNQQTSNPSSTQNEADLIADLFEDLLQNTPNNQDDPFMSAFFNKDSGTPADGMTNKVDTLENRNPASRPNSLIAPKNDESCGIANANRLYINGDTYEKGDWPWLAAMYVKKSASIEFHCAATLVSHKHAITAAHCVSVRNRVISSKDVILKVGAFDLQDWDDQDVVQLAVKKLVKHPDYSGGRQNLNDIAIIETKREVTFTDYVTPVCLWNTDPDQAKVVGKRGTVIGWGVSDDGTVATGEPQGGSIPIVSTATCRASLTQFINITSDKTLCAGTRDGSGPCNGDSGGGMYLHLNNRWYLRGIVSLSLPGDDERCDLGEYVVYTDAAQFNPWIIKIMEESK